MNIPTITMTPADARAKLNAYKVQLRRRVDAEYEAAAAGYEALAKGTALLNLTEAFAFAGLGADLRPRLAIARADRPEVRVSADHWNAHLQFDTRERRTSFSHSLLITVPFQHPKPDKMQTGFALVPMVPADVRPHGNLRDFFTLWEVQAWARRSQIRQPDRDPYLLKHLAGDLYVVVAEWELTDLERAIMTGRNRNR